MAMNADQDTRTTPLACAVLSGNSQAVFQLILGGANIAQVDSFGKTALYYATTHGFEEIVKLLVSTGAPADDGSLHCAAASGHISIISLLLKAGHNPNFLSPLHDMRPPLEVVLRTGKGNNLRDIMHILHSHGADPTYRSNGKSLVFIALDIEEAASIVPLLRAFMGKLVNKDFNLYEENSLIYSPLSYIIQNKANVSPKRREDLIRILRLGGCKEVYFHKTGPQPVGFKNAPGALAWQERYWEEVERADPAISWALDPLELQHQIRAYEAWSRSKDFNRFMETNSRFILPDLY